MFKFASIKNSLVNLPAFSKCEFCQKSAAKFDGFCKTSAKFSPLGAKKLGYKIYM